MTTAEQKQKLRDLLLEQRKNIPDEIYGPASERIREQLKRHPAFDRAGLVHCYASLNDRGEVDTHPLIRDILQMEQKRLAVPVTDFESDTLRHVCLNSYDDLKPSKWGVPEPKEGREVEDEREFDLVVVPMVAGDKDRNRLGYGKGFYDRFLSKVRCPTVGLCFEQCMVEALPVEEFDVKLGAIITQNRVIE